jgi:N-acetylated-alpha-linked acidic dipeptidase
MRAADADIEPFAFGNVASTVSTEVEDLEKLASTERERGETVDRLLGQKVYALAADPTESWGPPGEIQPASALDFTPLKTAVARLKASAHAYDSAAAARPAPAERRAQADAILQQTEQALTDPQGLPNRPWYVNLIYAPGVLTGYGAKTLPGVREAIEGRRWAEASDYIQHTAAALDALSAELDRATRLLAQ